jgi:ankyrin repeat protein
MKKKAFLHALIAGNLSLLQCMETSPHITDTALQKLITVVNKDSFNIVNLVKKQTKDDYHLEIIPQNMPLVLELDKERINTLFLDHVNDDELRPVFLAMEADVKARKKKGGYTCLHYARKPIAFKQLITAGAEIEAIADDKRTPLAELLFWGCFDDDDESLESAQILLEHKANPNIDLGSWGSILYRVMDYNNAIMRFKTAQLLCKFGAHVNAQTKESKRTPILVAVEKGLTDIVELFLPKLTPEEINALAYHDETLLHLAMEKDHGFNYHKARKIVPQIVVLLLKHQANPNISYRDGKTMPLHVAVDRGQEEIIKELINHGARKDLTDERCRTAYMIAKTRGYKQEILDLLYTDIIFKDDEGDDVVVLNNERNTNQINAENSQPGIIQKALGFLGY